MDAKGRMAIPTRYRALLDEICRGDLVITIDMKSTCLTLSPIPEWKKFEEKVAALPAMDDLGEMLGAVGRDDEGLGPLIEVVHLDVVQDRPQSFPDRGPAGLAGEHCVDGYRQSRGVGALPAALRSLEGDVAGRRHVANVDGGSGVAGGGRVRRGLLGR